MFPGPLSSPAIALKPRRGPATRKTFRVTWATSPRTSSASSPRIWVGAFLQAAESGRAARLFGFDLAWPQPIRRSRTPPFNAVGAATSRLAVPRALQPRAALRDRRRGDGRAAPGTNVRSSRRAEVAFIKGGNRHARGRDPRQLHPARLCRPVGPEYEGRGPLDSRASRCSRRPAESARCGHEHAQEHPAPLPPAFAASRSRRQVLRRRGR